MATVAVVKKTFTDDAGNVTPYERLAISGSVGGETHTLELKLINSEMQLVKIILASKENLEVHHAPNSGEQIEVTRKAATEGSFFDE